MNDSHGIEFEEVSRIGTWFLQRGTPTWIISYAEVALLQAEAAARGFAGGDAQSLYEAGIRASMQTYGISSADIDAYITSPMVAFAADTNTRLDQIAMQMWFLLYDQGPEAWAYQRRTGVPSPDRGAGQREQRPGPGETALSVERAFREQHQPTGRQFGPRLEQRAVERAALLGRQLTLNPSGARPLT